MSEHDPTGFANTVREFEELGTVPTYISRQIIEPWPRPVPGPSLITHISRKQMRNGTWPADTGSIYTPPRGMCEGAVVESIAGEREPEERMQAEEVLRRASLIELQDIDASRANLRATIELGNEATAQLRERIRAGDQQAAHVVAQGTQAATPRLKKEAAPKEAGDVVKQICEKSEDLLNGVRDDLQSRGHETSPREKIARLDSRMLFSVMRAGNQAAWLLSKLARLRMTAVERLIKHTQRANVKLAFYADRAKNIIGGGFLALDRAFTDLGFGGWMPFRFPDQFLMFGSAMRKLCAANGLICPKGPNHWKKFLEDTPEVPYEEEWPQAPLQMVPSWGVAKKDKEIKNFEELTKAAQGP